MGIAEEEIRKIKEKILKTDYSGYGLKHNPFPAVPVAPDTANIEEIRDFLAKYFYDKVREEEIKDLVRGFINIGYGEKRAGHMWLWGDWRVGKSAMLMRTFIAIHDALPDTVAIYVPTPRLGLLKSIFWYFVREYRADFFDRLSKTILTKLIIENPGLIRDDWIELWKETQEVLKGKGIEESKNYLIEQIKADLVDVFSLLEEAVDHERLYSTAISNFAPKGITDDVIDVLTDHLLNLEDRYAKIIGLENSREYVDHLISLLKMCIFVGYQHIFVFVDDVEDVVRTWTYSKAEKELDVLTIFLNRMYFDISMMGTMHPALFPVFEERYPRFIGRVAGDPLNFSLVHVKPFELESFREVVTYMISKAFEGVTPPYPTYPFTPEVIELLHKEMGGRAGVILASLYHLLRKGAEVGTDTHTYPEINIEFFEKCRGEIEKISAE